MSSILRKRSAKLLKLEPQITSKAENFSIGKGVLFSIFRATLACIIESGQIHSHFTSYRIRSECSDGVRRLRVASLRARVSFRGAALVLLCRSVTKDEFSEGVVGTWFLCLLKIRFEANMPPALGVHYGRYFYVRCCNVIHVLGVDSKASIRGVNTWVIRTS